MDTTGKDCISVTPRRLDSASSFTHHRVSIAIEPAVSSRVNPGYSSVVSRAPTSDFESLKSEQTRLNTFYSTDCPWPVIFISPADCAKAGFFFLNDGDKVQCAFCRGVAGEWDVGDIPAVEHKKHFPRCPFICNLPVGNIPISQEENRIPRIREEPHIHAGSYGYDVCGPFEGLVDGGDSYANRGDQGHGRGALPLTVDNDDVTAGLAIRTGSGPARKHLATQESRLKTFTEWPNTTGQSAEKMADAGFFYIGVSDHVKCFYCNGGLRNWEEGDDPWREHAIWFGNCPYVLLNKGKDYIKQVNRSKSGESTCSEKEKAKNSVSSESDDEASSASGQTSESEDSQPESSGESPTPSSSDVGSSDSSDEDVVITQHAIAVQLVQDSRKIAECYEKPALEEPSQEANCPKPKEADLAEELRRLKEAHQCKICMDNEVGVVFLPCGHFVACVRCATALSNCALCRQPIKAVVRTYLS